MGHRQLAVAGLVVLLVAVGAGAALTGPTTNQDAPTARRPTTGPPTSATSTSPRVTTTGPSR
jgi:hypothetical protein